MEQLKLIMGNMAMASLCVAWVMGAVLAKAGFLTFISIVFPFYAWYLLVEKIMLDSGFI